MTLLPIIALVSAALFSGAATYITFVEHPARLQLDDRPLLAQWQPSYKKALPLQSGLAIVDSLSGLASWYLSGEWRWLIGSLVLLANWPFTLLAIMPTNQRLQAIAPGDAGSESRNLLVTLASSTTSEARLRSRRRLGSHGPWRRLPDVS